MSIFADICIFHSILFHSILFTQQIDQDVRKEVDEAVEFAKESPELPALDVYTDVYKDTVPEAIRGCDPFTWGHPKY